MGILDAPAKKRTPLGAWMQPFLPKTSAPEAVTITWAATTGYSGEKSTSWNNAAILGKVDRGAKLQANGAWGQNFPAIANSFGCPYYLEFLVSGPDVAIQMTPKAGTTAEYKVWVDGWAVTDYVLRAAPQTDTFLKLNWGSDKIRLVRIALSGEMLFTTIRTPATGYFYPNNSARRPRVAMIGDSYTQAGLGGAPGELVSASGIPMILSNLTGWDVFACGVGGTGPCKDIGAGGFKYGDSGRMSQLATLGTLDLIIVAGFANDLLNGFTAANTNAAMTTFLNALAAARPGVPVVISGAQTVQSTSGSVAAYSAAIKAHLLAHPIVRGYIDWTLPDFWITGTGNVTAKNGNGNADIFIISDNVHLTRAGAEYVAHRTVDDAARIEV